MNIQEIITAVKYVLYQENLVVFHSYEDQYPTLQVGYDGENLNLTLGTRPGNAYCCSENECFINVELPVDEIEAYSDEMSDDYSEDEYYLECSVIHVNENIDEWARSIADTIA